MKILKFLLILFLQYSLHSLNLNAMDRAYVISKSGLFLRTEPSVGGKKITLIPKNEIFEVLDKNGIEDSIESIQAQWWKVKYKDQSGWIFSGFARKFDEQFYDPKYSLYQGDKYLNVDFYNTLQQLFDNINGSICQIPFISRETFESGDGDDVFKERYGMDVYTVIDAILFGSHYETYVIQILNIEKRKSDFILKFIDGRSGGKGPEYSAKVTININAKFIRWQIKGPISDERAFTFSYAPRPSGEFICNSSNDSVKWYQFPFLK
ncbi:SH3 domain-containing protein [Leptospira sp. id769339]|uniref:SH3 domain-containing protein n=1 Tax=Leptospira sp. id769339 TaxID=2864221 RepID=UPI00214B4888|nr:SH3 domain-containing protein [Leptospira sp. id769339]MCR1795357.1 SH3 domain-containing protein [Leptospira sp. id769339]